MKITRIQVQGFLKAQDIDLRIEKPILLCAGRNGAAKSTIGEAVKFAIGRKDYAVRGVCQKKDYGQLLNDNAKAGGAVVTINDNMAESFSFTLPKGEFGGPEAPDAMRIALDGQRFVQMTEPERRDFIFNLGGKRVTPEVAQPLLLKAVGDTHADKVKQVLIHLSNSLESAEKHASEEATKAKGAWRLVTNQVWGPKVGDGWKAPVPDMPQGDLEALKQELADQEAYFNQLNENVGAIKAAQQMAASDAQRRAGLEASAKKVPELEQQLAAAIKERDEYQQQVEQMRQRAQGSKQGLVHDMARFIATTDMPRLGAEVHYEAGKLIERYEQEHGSLVANAEPAGDVAERLPEHERGLQVLVNRAANLQRDLDAAKMAKGQYDALEPATETADASKELAEVTALLDAARAKKIELQNAVLDFEAAANGRAKAEQRTKDADKQHKDIMAWLEIAAQLAPNGIAGTMLAEALVPVNHKLAQASADTGWPQVVINDDMSIKVGKRTYLMESESFQWRAAAMIAQAVSEVSGLKVLCLDRCDVLDIPARGELFGWIDLLVEYGSLDCALLFATLKAVPNGMPETFQLHWIADGAVADPQAEAA